MIALRGAVAALALLATPAMAADPVRIGMITTLSGPGGYLGQDTVDGFRIAMDGGKLGGVAVDLSIEDDGLNPGQAKRIAERFLQGQKVRIVTGTIFTNVAEAIVPEVLDAGAFYVGPNSGPTSFAGKQCNKNYFIVGFQAAVPHQGVGLLANESGYKRVFIVAPNYQASRDAVAGFKRTFKGEVAGEIYTKLDQSDFSAELAQLRAAKPDAVWPFMPGGVGINFLKQYGLAGLNQTIPVVVSQAPFDWRIMSAVGQASLGIEVATYWSDDFDNAANKAFVETFRKAYNRLPTPYAAQGYDTARAIGAALKAVGGDLGKPDQFGAALRKADFESVRGKFRFGVNQHPIQDLHAAKVVKDEAGNLQIRTSKRMVADHVDPYADECKM
jgi:branched-chain amino acid transport system substrate-binding protein